MFRKILLYTIVFTMVGTISFLGQTVLMDLETDFLQLLEQSYIFHFFFSLLLVIAFQILSKNQKVFEQLGFLYIGMLVFKIVVFTAMFFPQLMGDQPLPHFYRAMMLLPIIIFLTLEVIFVSKIMREK
ncbi:MULTISPECIES: DUF6168 family protein [Maribacter]|uniref:Uncharacterized protein n=2 Tax=Maribacter TaxID=252356 RepID=A0A5R8MA53_9FLAO|nr:MULTISPECIES: DUF6168 family protein [Maribacter]KAA2219219.1 hypothetical protein F0361_06300 [Maribacter flavus]TLF46448.1 hypothetical protein FEK29_01320 [Maribacter aurantiacus]